MKLFRVYLRGCHGSQYCYSYVVARDAGEAYRKVREDLDARDIGGDSERALASIELYAEDAEYPECGTRLYLPEETSKC